MTAASHINQAPSAWNSIIIFRGSGIGSGNSVLHFPANLLYSETRRRRVS